MGRACSAMRVWGGRMLVVEGAAQVVHDHLSNSERLCRWSNCMHDDVDAFKASSTRGGVVCAICAEYVCVALAGLPGSLV